MGQARYSTPLCVKYRLLCPFLSAHSEMLACPNLTHAPHHITNFMGHNLIIIIMWKLLFIGLCAIDTNVIHLLVLFEHWCHVHYLDTNVICLFVLFIHKCCMYIHVVYTWKSCTWLPCLNIAWHSCLNNMNPWNNRFCTYLEWTHETYKFVMQAQWTIPNRLYYTNYLNTKQIPFYFYVYFEGSPLVKEP